VGRLSTFKRGFASTLVLDVASRGMSALTLIVLLRALDTADFAFVVLLLNVGQFLGSAATGGIRLRYARIEAERVSRGDEEPSAFHSTLTSGSILIVLVAAIGLLICSALGVGKGASERLDFALLATTFTLGTAGAEMAIYHWQAQLRFMRAGLIQFTRATVVFVLALGATFGIFESATAVGTAMAIGVCVVAAIVSLPIAFETRGAERGRDGRFGFGRETMSLTLYSLASAGWAYLDIFLVAALLNDVAVASYGAALRYISIVMGPVPALVAVLRVRTSQHDMVDSERARREMMFRWIRQTFIPTLLVIGGGGIAAIWAIPFVDGGKYPLSVPIFEVLLIVTLVQFILLPAPGLLIAQKRYTTLAVVNVIAVVVNVILASAAAPLIGVVGVAVAGTTVGIAQAFAVMVLALNSTGGSTSGPDEVAREAAASATDLGPVR